MKEIRFHLPRIFDHDKKYKSTFSYKQKQAAEEKKIGIEELPAHTIELIVYNEIPVDYLDQMPESQVKLSYLAMKELINKNNGD